jgi:integral membrane protein (TIGR01906 family)
MVRISARISCVPAALFIIAVPLFLVTASVTWAFNSPGLYEDGFEKYQISLTSGITYADLRQVGADLRGYFNSNDEPLDVRTRILGTERELFNPTEIAHMRDVKRLVWGVYVLVAVSAAYLLATLIVGFWRRRRSFVETLAPRLLWGGALTLVLLIAFGLLAATGFDTLFLRFHQFSFANDFWQLDPRTDYLVRLFPQDFWFDATMWVALRAITGALILTAVGGGYLVYQRWSAQQERAKSLDQATET